MRRLVVVLFLLVLTAGCIEPVAENADDLPDVPDGLTDGDAADDDAGDDEPTHADGELSVHAIDVGQADATLVVGPEGETMLIDTGDWRNDGETVLEYLDAQGVDRVDYLVSTHGHADHIGGSAAVIEHYETERQGVGAVYDSGVAHTSQTYENYLDAIDEHDVTLFQTQAGDEIPMNGAHVPVFNPPADRENDDLHDNSVAVAVEHGDASFLFTGDAEEDAEQRLVEDYSDDLDATGYQAGHHGSATSSTDPFLDVVDPEFAIVSAAYDSQYGHPHDEVLDRFADRDVDVYWTGVHGTIVATSDGDTVEVATVVDATTDAASIDDAPAANAVTTAPVEHRQTYEVAPAATQACCPTLSSSLTATLVDEGVRA